METAPLKLFATWARTALIREVSARIAAVLAPASKERVESTSAVTALELDIAAEGGGETGRDAVADKAAYTWFNRIIALRFMDANGYTGTGVVSPPRGQTTGQTEVLADAKRGIIDPAVVTNKRTIEEITALLDGTRRSDDAQGEAYSLLLAEYCRHWNRSMPFMFEREGDYTELLIPANLLADDSVVARAVTVLTEDVCRDVEVIGWLYQFYISERKDEVLAGFKKKRKAGAREIPAATQLFTPHWIVRYVVENSLGRLWMLNRPTSRLAEQMEYYIAPADKETDFLRISTPSQLRVIDPAVGSGHMLTYAFDLLYLIYEEEGYAPLDIPGLILEHNLFGVEIDVRAGALAAFALTMKARAKQRTFFSTELKPNVCVLEPIFFDSIELSRLVGDDQNRSDEEVFWNEFQHADSLGSLIRPNATLISTLTDRLAESPPIGLIEEELYFRARRVLDQAKYLSQRYEIVIANPPYMGTRNLAPGVVNYIQENFSEGAPDLFAAFMVRSFSLAKPGGEVGLMSPLVWMFISGYQPLREFLTGTATITSLVQLEYSGFDGATVPVCAFTFKTMSDPLFRGAYVRLSDFVGSAIQGPKYLEAVKDASCGWLYRTATSAFRSIPGVPIAYWAGPNLSATFTREKSLSDVAEFTGSANKTGDNSKYLRRSWEVSLGKIGAEQRWVPYSKGGGRRKWWGLTSEVVDWSESAISFYKKNPTSNLLSSSKWFLPGVTYSMITSSINTFRFLPAGAVFDMGGPVFYPTDENFHAVLLLCNSSFAQHVLRMINPTLNLQGGDIKRIPFPTLSSAERIQVRTLVDRAIAISRADWNYSETALDFASLELLETTAKEVELRSAVREQLTSWRADFDELKSIEEAGNALLSSSLGVADEVSLSVPDSHITLIRNVGSSDLPEQNAETRNIAAKNDVASQLVSYAVGCMFGRYSLDLPGMILANQGDTLQDYLAKVPDASFLPDNDNVIPIVDGDWFEDDIVARFRQFLRVAFGEEHFEDNLRVVTESLGVKDLRDYFVKSFYKDHVQRYKKRPIYWLFSSPKGSFSALIYMHRYTPSTVSTVLNEYLREFKSKLEASRQHHVRLAASDGTPREKAAAEKEVDRLRKVLLELDEYEHDVLYPLATQQLAIDLDDGVKANYPKFGAALKKIPGLEASDE